MRHHMLRSLLCAALMAYGSAALAQEDPSLPVPVQEPQDPASPSPSPSPSPEPSPSPSPSPTASPSPAASPEAIPGSTSREPSPGTPAPKPAGPITALVKAVPQRTVFVGNEPITVVYHLVAATGVAVNPAPLATLNGEFYVVSVAVGERTGIPGVKDLHVQRVTLVVRFPHEGPLGAYQLPGTTLKYSQDVITEQKDGAYSRNTVIGTVAVPSVKFEKVAAYVETDILHETTFLGDPNDARLTVHLGPEAELLNEFPPQGAPAPEGVTFLSAFKPTEPFVLLATSRTSHGTGTYVVTYVYHFSTLDIGPKPFPFAFPPVQVRRRDDAQSQITVIAPKAAGITIRPRVDKKTPAEPLKEAAADPAREHLLFLQLPVAGAGLLAAYLSLTGITSVIGWVRSRKDRKRKRPVTTEEDAPASDPVYETNWFRRWEFRRHAQTHLHAYNSAPDRVACERLRTTVARLLASHLKGNARVDRIRAQTLSAAAFSVSPGSVLAYWRDTLAVCESSLERNKYIPFALEHKE